MSRAIVIILPVADPAASRRFYEALGCSRDARFSDETTVSMNWSDSIALRLTARDAFAAFAPRPLSDPHATTEKMIALALDSREAVDTVAETAISAGGKAGEGQDIGYMYGRSFEDPDGHVFWPVWMKDGSV